MTQSEEEYFKREEAEKIKRLSLAKNARVENEEKKRLKELHWMCCPKCGMELKEIIFKGVTLDQCFECRGVFLDDGELEKLAGKESGFVDSIYNLFR